MTDSRVEKWDYFWDNGYDLAERSVRVAQYGLLGLVAVTGRYANIQQIVSKVRLGILSGYVLKDLGDYTVMKKWPKNKLDGCKEISNVTMDVTTALLFLGVLPKWTEWASDVSWAGYSFLGVPLQKTAGGAVEKALDLASCLIDLHETPFAGDLDRAAVGVIAGLYGAARILKSLISN